MKKDFALKIFEAFSIQRWNDLIRPFDLVEMDNDAEKMVIAYIIGKYEESKGARVDWDWIIHASLFSLLRKIQLCDIKSPIQRLIKNQYPQEYIRLNKWVFSQYSTLIEDNELYSRFGDFMDSLSGNCLFDQTSELTMRIYRASHKYASFRELEMLSVVNEVERYDGIKKQLNAELSEYLDLKGLQLLMTRQKPFEFLMRVEQLRFQTRWNQTPRVPKTSVLGHCFFVAILTLLFTKECGKKITGKRLYNDYFSALFHDLPESVTRDIISPVKTATDGLPDVVKTIEEKVVAQELVPLMEEFYRDEIMYFTSDEFSNRVIVEGCLVKADFDEINSRYSEDTYNAIDGRLVRLSDHYAALMEADLSIRHGITSAHLVSGRDNLLSAYADNHNVNGIDASSLFQDFAG